MSSLIPYGNNRRNPARADEFEILDRRTRYTAAEIKANSDLDHYRDHTEARLAEQALENTNDLVGLAKQLAQHNPEAVPYFARIIKNYADRSADRIAGRRFS